MPLITVPYTVRNDDDDDADDRACACAVCVEKY